MPDQPLMIHLVRHGETPYNAAGRFVGRTDVELSEHGQAQAQRVAETLATRPLNGIYTSPLLRARQTAELIAKAHGLPIQERIELVELHHGEVEGLPYPELATRYPDVLKAWMADP